MNFAERLFLNRSISLRVKATASSSKSNPLCHHQYRQHQSSPVRAKSVHSGLQKEVISLYRRLLRTCRVKDLETQAGTGSSSDTSRMNKNNITIPFLESLNHSSTSIFAMRQKFRKQCMEMSKRDHARIEHGIRQGEKYIKMMKMSGVRGISSSRK